MCDWIGISESGAMETIHISYLQTLPQEAQSSKITAFVHEHSKLKGIFDAS
jgi:hypothetical protein